MPLLRKLKKSVASANYERKGLETSKAILGENLDYRTGDGTYNELGTTKLSDSLYQPQPTGRSGPCGIGTEYREPEVSVIEKNHNVYSTAEIGHRGAGYLVWGGPSPGTRLDQRLHMQDSEKKFWDTAAPMVPARKAPHLIEPEEQHYWSGKDAYNRSCMETWGFWGWKDWRKHHHQGEGCLIAGGADTRQGCSKPLERTCINPAPVFEGGGIGVGPDWKPHHGEATCLGIGETRRLCSAPEEYFEPKDDLTATQYWGKAKSHGINDIEADSVISRWEKHAAVKGTLSTKEFTGVVHPVKPMHQADQIPTQGQIENYWGNADARSRKPYDGIQSYIMGGQGIRERECCDSTAYAATGAGNRKNAWDVCTVSDRPTSVNMNHTYLGYENIKHPRDLPKIYDVDNKNLYQS